MEAPPATESLDVPRKQIEDWEANKTTWHAADLVGAALVLEHPEVAMNAARYLIEHEDEASLAALSLASSMLSKNGTDASSALNDPVSQEQAVAHLRRRLTNYPRNSVAYVDLALAYTILGEERKAEHALTIALSLSPHNRFVLRSAARHFVHRNDPEAAHWLLRTNDATRVDPWLLAAEIAVSSARKKQSRFVKLGRTMMDNASIHPRHTSELASALATQELEAGQNKKARRLFKRALVDPTENSVAQVEWAADQLGHLTINLDEFHVPRLFEANAWSSFYGGDWRKAVEQGASWFKDQPFSVRPAEFTSYIASSLLEDDELAKSILNASLKANPGNPGLINNLAFALTNLGDVAEAERLMKSIESAKVTDLATRIAITATRGLIHFRRGEDEKGRTLYLEAIDGAAEGKLERTLAGALIYLAREELRLRTPHVDEMIRLARAATQRVNATDIRALLKKLEDASQRAGTLTVSSR